MANFTVQVESGRRVQDGNPSVGPVSRSILPKDGFPPLDPDLNTSWDVFRIAVEKFPSNRMLRWREMKNGKNLTVQEFYNTSVPISTQATFPYLFAVSKYLQESLFLLVVFVQLGSFDLVASIVYEIDPHRYQNVFYNGTIEVIEAGGFISIESVFLGTFGVALLVLSGLWAYGQIQQFSKKTKRSPKVEVATRTTKAHMDEWLQGTAYARSLLNKSKKRSKTHCTSSWCMT